MTYILLLVRSGRHWEKRKIKWAILGKSKSLTEKEIKDAVKAAFEKWSAAIPNTFTFEKVQRWRKVNA